MFGYVHDMLQFVVSYGKWHTTSDFRNLLLDSAIFKVETHNLPQSIPQGYHCLSIVLC